MAERAFKTSKSMDNFVKTKNQLEVILAETLFSNSIGEHYLAFSLADHFSQPDSKIAFEQMKRFLLLTKLPNTDSEKGFSNNEKN